MSCSRSSPRRPASRSSTTRPRRRTTPAPTTSRSSARPASPTSKPSRSTGSPRRCSTPTCSRRFPRTSQGRWLDWKEAAATDADGNLIAYGTDIGPQGICYRSDLFAAAGLPDRPRRGRRAVRRRLGQLLHDRCRLHREDRQAVHRLGQLRAPGHGEPARVRVRGAGRHDRRHREPGHRRSVRGRRRRRPIPIAAYAGQWSEDWFASMASGEFAAMLCPGWMLGVISGNAPDITGWDIADAFPGGGGNWGGSYLTVPANGANVEAAQQLADWLTAPEQQMQAFANAGTFPSQLDALAAPSSPTRRTSTSTTRRPVRSSPTVPRRSRSRRTRDRSTSSSTTPCRTRSPASSTASRTRTPAGTPG